MEGQQLEGRGRHTRCQGGRDPSGTPPLLATFLTAWALSAALMARGRGPDRGGQVMIRWGVAGCGGLQPLVVDAGCLSHFVRCIPPSRSRKDRSVLVCTKGSPWAWGGIRLLISGIYWVCGFSEVAGRLMCTCIMEIEIDPA